MAENFNYISFGNWGYVEGPVDTVTMGRGRMFEYTPPDTGKRLESLDPTAVSFLETLPTFMCTEVRQAEESDAVSMLIRFGRISQTSPQQREVFTTFETLVDFGEVEFDNIEVAASVFGADRFQLYRTHWAVREGDAQEVLARLASIKPDLAQLVTKTGAVAVDGKGIQPPPRDKNILGAADTVETFLQLLYGSAAKVGTEIFLEATPTPIMS